MSPTVDGQAIILWPPRRAGPPAMAREGTSTNNQRFNPPRWSVDLYPVQRAVDRLLPARVARRPLLVAPFRQPALGLIPVGAQLVGGGPEAGGQAGRVGGAERGGLGDDGPADRHAEDVRLQLHAQVVGGDA